MPHEATCLDAVRSRVARSMDKTNALRRLDSLRIPYQAHAYSDSLISAEEVARELRIPPSRVFKTLVVMRESGRPLLTLVPGDSSLDLKLLAQSTGDKRLRMATQREAEAVTGLKVGGISALALHQKGFDVYVDSRVMTHVLVYVSAGRRGLDVSLAPEDLLRATGAVVVTVVRQD